MFKDLVTFPRNERVRHFVVFSFNVYEHLQERWLIWSSKNTNIWYLTMYKKKERYTWNDRVSRRNELEHRWNSDIAMKIFRKDCFDISQRFVTQTTNGITIVKTNFTMAERQIYLVSWTSLGCILLHSSTRCKSISVRRYAHSYNSKYRPFRM